MPVVSRRASTWCGIEVSALFLLDDGEAHHLAQRVSIATGNGVTCATSRACFSAFISAKERENRATRLIDMISPSSIAIFGKYDENKDSS